jgi:hypothetical protein
MNTKKVKQFVQKFSWHRIRKSSCSKNRKHFKFGWRFSPDWKDWTCYNPSTKTLRLQANVYVLFQYQQQQQSNYKNHKCVTCHSTNSKLHPGVLLLIMLRLFTFSGTWCVAFQVLVVYKNKHKVLKQGNARIFTRLLNYKKNGYLDTFIGFFANNRGKSPYYSYH